jgi:hypothetical protein
MTKKVMKLSKDTMRNEKKVVTNVEGSKSEPEGDETGPPIAIA